MSLKIGLLGGAFDPPTLGHLELADYLIKNNIMDEVWLEPCYKSFYDKKMTPCEIRLEMCQLAINDFGNDKIKICDFEFKNKLECETNEGIDLFLKVFDQNNKYYFMIGMDNANKINTWGNWEALINKIPFLVFPRAGYDRKDNISWYLEKPHIYLDNFESIDISSTNIRNFYKNRNDKKEHHELISKSVQDIIDKLNLFIS